MEAKFEALALKKVLICHGSNTKVWIKSNNNKKFRFIKEVQKYPVLGSAIHKDGQIVSKDHELKFQIPIVFNGEDELKKKQLQLKVYKSEITVFAKLDLMLDAIYVDVSEKKSGEMITLNDFNVNKQLKVSGEEDVVYGMVTDLNISLLMRLFKLKPSKEPKYNSIWFPSMKS